MRGGLLLAALAAAACSEDAVTAARPAIALSAERLDFGTPWIGTTVVRSLQVSSVGTAPVRRSGVRGWQLLPSLALLAVCSQVKGLLR